MIIGVLSNRGKRGWTAFKERAELVKPYGIELCDIPIDCLPRLKENKKVKCKFWLDNYLTEKYIHLPKVIYDRVDMLSPCRKKVSELISFLRNAGNIVFNDIEFRSKAADKWLTYKVLTNGGIQTPETFKFSPKQALSCLKSNSYIFIKPRVASQGRGQITIKKQKSLFGRAKYVVNEWGNKFKFNTSELSAYVKLLSLKGLNESNYIVQKGIAVKKLNNQVFDLRSIAQRDSKGELKHICTYARIASRGSEQSNISKNGIAQDPVFLFKDWNELEKKVIDLTNKTVNIIDSVAPIAEIGLDIVLDEQYNLYVLEINSKPGSYGIRQLIEKPSGSGFIYMTSNQIRKKWRDNLNSFLINPILFAKFITSVNF